LTEFIAKRNISSTGKNILKKRYFSSEEKEWKDIVNRVVNFVAEDFDEKYEPDSKEQLRKMMLHTYFVPNSPALVNAGNNNMGLCACFVTDFKDTIEDIYKTKLDFALVARKGGGCGTSLEKIRPEGSKVNGSTHGYAGGGIKFADTISHDADALTQAGFRSMAIMFTQSVYHPDIIKFITAKTEEGRIANANISVIVDDNFMNKVKNDEDYWTEFNGVKYNQYKAKDIFDLIVEGAWKNGEPGLLFRNRIDNSPYQYTGQKIFSTNPCFTGDMKLLTKNGYKTFLELNNKNVEVINAFGNVQTGKVFYTGNKETIQLNLSNKQIIKCTPDHILFDNLNNSIKAEESKNKKLLPYLNYKTLDNEFILYGFAQGDGSLGRLSSDSHLGVELHIGKKDQDIYNLLSNHQYTKQERIAYVQDIKNTLINLGFSSERLPERSFPNKYDSWNLYEKASFLRGCFSANGCINNVGRITYKGTCKSFILKLQETLLKDFNIDTYITTNKKHNIEFSNGNYQVKESYDLNINRHEEKVKFYNEINFYQEYKIKILTDKLIDQSPYVLSIKSIGNQDVYDFSLPDVHLGSVNGFVVHNCSEQPLPPNGVCNIGSLDLSKFYDLKKQEFDFELFEIASRLGVRFLDAVIDKTSFPTKEIEQWAIENRAIALGIMGWADLLLMMKIPYGTDQANSKLEEILEFMSKISYNESEKLGKKFGIPLQCQKIPIPRRNITVTTIAPTGTVSLIAGCSSGLEPIFSEVTIRNDRTGTYTFENELASKSYFRCAVSSNGAQEVTWEEHVDTLASAQKHIDSGVSKTINFPNKTHKETIGKAMFKAWESDCKGIAVYRNGSRKVEVLSPKNLKKEKCPVCGNDLIIVNEKQKCLICKTETLIENINGAYDN